MIYFMLFKFTFASLSFINLYKHIPQKFIHRDSYDIVQYIKISISFKMFHSAILDSCIFQDLYLG